MADPLNPNNIKTLKALKKHLENQYLTTWPDVVKVHRQAILNALAASIEVCEIAKSNGGIITMLDGFQASQKTDLFSSQSPLNDNA